MARAHRHDTIELNFPERGELVYLFGGREVLLRAGGVAAFWGVTPHQLVHCPTGSVVHWLTVPLATFVSWGLPDSFVARLFQGEPLVSSEPAAQPEDTLRFTRWERELASASAYDHLTVSLEIQARVRRLAQEVPLTTADGAEPANRDRDHRNVAAMAGFIARHSTEAIRVHHVASAVHLHPHYAMGLFRKVTGMTMNGYLTECRVAEAQRLLLTTELSVIAVAHLAGFQSQSQFYACFGAVCGEPPGSYRRRRAQDTPGVPAEYAG